jgi:KDO2-lipid IV(A) lauroyltransferase
MAAIGYYLALPFLYAIALLPFPVLYLLSDLLNLVLFGLIGYRKDVIHTNLRNSFPEKTEAERQQIASKFQSWFCDLVLETVKTLTITKHQVRELVQFEGTDLLKEMADRRQSVVLVLGHLGNWELAGARYAAEEGLPQLYVIYHPLENEYFNKLVIHMRTRLGNRLYTMKEAARDMIRDRHLNTATAFIADQTPPPERAHWMEFLHQDTPIFLGTGTLANKLRYPVVYMSVRRSRRGHYIMKAELLIGDPALTSPCEITERHTKRLEADILAQPEIWLWTHRRWKHRRPQTVS